MRIPRVAGLVLAGCLHAAGLPAQATPRTAPPADTAGVPVVVGVDTVFRVQVGVPPYTAHQRAAALSILLDQVAARRDVRLDSLILVPSAERTLIRADSVALLYVTDEDAAAAGIPRDALARDWAHRLEAVFGTQSSAARERALVRSWLEAVLSTLAFALLLWLGRRAERGLHARITAWTNAKVQSLEGEAPKVVTPAMVRSTVVGVTRLVRYALVLALGYAWLVILFGAFEWTRPLAERILQMVVAPLVRVGRDLVGYLPNLVFIVVMVTVLRLALRLIATLFHGIESGTFTFRNFPPEWADPTYKIVRTLVIAFGLILIFPYLPGAGSDAFKAVSLFAGALFSLGSSGAVANLVSGSVIVYTRAFRVGDYVRIGETEGMVVERSLLVTRIRTTTNIITSIPNATVLGSHVQNLSTMAKQGGIIVQSRVTIGYDAPWRKVHALLLDAATRTQGVLATPAPFVVQESLDDYYPTYCLNVYTDLATGLRVFQLRSHLNENIQDAFFEGGVEILSPRFTAIRDGNRTAMPPQYLPPDYRAPGFRVERDGGPA